MHSTPTDSDGQRRHCTAYTPSFRAMGWMSLLLLVSGATSFSADVTTKSRISGIPSSGSVLATAYVESTKRSYRRRSNAQTSTGLPRSKFHSTRSRTSVGLFSTRLQYRDGDDAFLSQQDDTTPTTDSDKPSWWKGIITPTKKDSPIDEKQRNVDDYLEFLDRRYNRLHSEEKPESKKAGFSALNWLTDHSPSKNEVDAAQQHEDALYVLGVAELASKRLLQKHHRAVSNPSQVEHDAPKPLEVIDATVVNEGVRVVRPEVPVSATRSAMMVTGMVDAGATVLRRLYARRRVLVRYQMIKLRAAVAFLMRAFSKTPKTASGMWKLGGGNKALAFTASAAVAVFLVVRPMVQVMIYEAAYRG